MSEMTQIETLVYDYDVNGLVGAYKVVEAKIDAMEALHKTELAPLKMTLQSLNGAIAIKMDANGLENVRTEFGTAYFAITEQMRVTNREDFFNWVIANAAKDVLTSAVSKDAVRERQARGEDVPGLEIVPTRKLHVRKPS